MPVIVTHCDKNFLSRSIALVHSLLLDSDCPEIWIFSHDPFTAEKLNSLKIARLRVFEIFDLIEKYPDLRKLQELKTKSEFLFAITPFLMLFCNEKSRESVWYIDADVYFFKKFNSLSMRVKQADVAVSGHNFPKRLQYLEMYGKFNVGIVYMSGNRKSRETIKWWSERCLEDTSLFDSPDVYGDQKYLDFFQQFDIDLYTLESPGVCAAPWNIENVKSFDEISTYHFSGLRIYSFFSILGFSIYSLKPKTWHKKLIALPYLEEITKIEIDLFGKRIKDTRQLSRRAILKMFLLHDFILSFRLK